MVIFNSLIRTLWLGGLCVAAGGAMAQGGNEMVGKGEIRWNERMVRATGSGAPNADAPNVAVARITAERTAEMDARRNLLEVLKGVRIDSTTTIGGKMATSDSVNGTVSGVVRGARVVDKRYFSDGGVEVTVEMPLDADILQSVLPMDRAGSSAAPTAAGGSACSSLIVDARGLSFDPSLSPSLVDESGTVLYDLTYADPAAVERNGVASFAYTDAQVDQHPLKGDDPLRVKAAASSEGRLTLGAAEAAKVSQSDSSCRKQARVIIRLD